MQRAPAMFPRALLRSFRFSFPLARQAAVLVPTPCTSTSTIHTSSSSMKAISTVDMAAGPLIEKVEAHPDFLRIYFLQHNSQQLHWQAQEPQEGAATALRQTLPASLRSADFHWFWLRHNCDNGRHILTRERVVDASDIPLDTRPAQVQVEQSGSAVWVAWEKGRGLAAGILSPSSVFTASWLAQHAYAVNRAGAAGAASPLPPSDLQTVTVDARMVAEERRRLTSDKDTAAAAMVQAARQMVARHGVAYVTGVLASGVFSSSSSSHSSSKSSSSTGSSGGGGSLPHPYSSDSEDPLTAAAAATTALMLDAFCSHASFRVTASHFGQIEDLRQDNKTNANTDQLGYTDAAVDVHSDQPFIARPPRYQALQCIRPAAAGGENMVVDALAAALYLRGADRRHGGC